jgi:hypothetical protein
MKDTTRPRAGGPLAPPRQRGGGRPPPRPPPPPSPSARGCPPSPSSISLRSSTASQGPRYREPRCLCRRRNPTHFLYGRSCRFFSSSTSRSIAWRSLTCARASYPMAARVIRWDRVWPLRAHLVYTTLPADGHLRKAGMATAAQYRTSLEEHPQHPIRRDADPTLPTRRCPCLPALGPRAVPSAADIPPPRGVTIQ